MKQLIIGIVLAVCLVGCGEKPKFSINESDKISHYANNPIFKLKKKLDDEDSKYIFISYGFEDEPQFVWGINIEGLGFDNGIISLQYPKTEDPETLVPDFSLVFKGEKSFNMVFDRIMESEIIRGCKSDGILAIGDFAMVKFTKIINEEEKTCIILNYDAKKKEAILYN